MTLLIILVVIVAVLLVLGAISLGCQTLTETPQQKIQRYRRMAELNRMMINEDIETFLLMDKPTRLSRWRVPVETIK